MAALPPRKHFETPSRDLLSLSASVSSSVKCINSTVPILALVIAFTVFKPTGI